ncbi:MAG: FumA C-terminus/TtdB family hydratase beta subunit [Proteobacteria bacterium]|nr:FumA C-terminus/TtdB family hydratase beta subunit [Pseudomonadota bacterium]
MTSSQYYHPPFVTAPDQTQYRLMSTEGITSDTFKGRAILLVDPKIITHLMTRAFTDMSHLFRKDHLEGFHKILQDPEASDNDRYVADELLRNAVIASQRVFPSCQDTGTAIVMGWKGSGVWVEGKGDYPDQEAITRGVFRAYQDGNLRFSQMAPLSMYEEKNTGSNLPVDIKIYASHKEEYQFLTIAKGGGSANKTFLFQKTRALLNQKNMTDFLTTVLKSLGTAACPPYHLAVVIGGLSAEQNLQTVKLASCRYYDSLPWQGNQHGQAFRCQELEKQIAHIAYHSDIGAQFGGKYFLHSVRALRLPRHAASLVVGIGVSCSADRQVLAKITRDGTFIEDLEEDPSQYLPQNRSLANGGVTINLERPMAEILQTLSQYPVGTRFMLSGPLVVARDMAHALICQKFTESKELPSYFKDHPIYYAGPAKTPQGFPSGSFGPTTSQRMDSYVPLLQKEGASLVMLGKGNRSQMVVDSCQRHHGFYLGSIGGPAARLAKDCIIFKEVLDYQELGMEAVWRIIVKDFPAFLITNNQGHDFFLNRGSLAVE